MTAATDTLAVVLAVAGSGCYAIATVTQQSVAARLPPERPFDPVVLVRLAHRRTWLLGLVALIAGFSLQATALGLGRLVVIEPAMASGLLFALALAALRDRRPLRAPEWAAIFAVVGGLAVFLVAGQPAGGQRTASAAVLGLTAAAVAGLIGLCALLAGRLRSNRRALLLGLGGGIAAGGTDALTKSVAALASHPITLVADVRLYLLVAVGLLTYTIQQNGYRAAGLAAFLPAFAVLEPVTGALLGLLIYHEGLSDGPGQIGVELVACAAVTWGIARLASSNAIQGELTEPAEPEPASPVPADQPLAAAGQFDASGPAPAGTAEDA